MAYDLLKTAHLLAIVVWVGGMVFAHFFLRPALGTLEPAQRLVLMHDVLRRFFVAVSAAIAVTLVSGAAMIDVAARQASATGGHLVIPLGWMLMTALGLVMTGVFGFIRWRHFRALQQALLAGQTPAAAAALAQIRRWVLVNLVLGVTVIVIAVGQFQFGS